MKRSSVLSLLLPLLLALASAGLAHDVPPIRQPEPYIPGRDVPWVPTPQVLVDKMLDMARLTPQDVVVDLGSGDGRTVIAAARRGARARGIEFNPDLVEQSKRNAAEAGVAGAVIRTSACRRFTPSDLSDRDRQDGGRAPDNEAPER